MKKYILILSAFVISLSSCTKDDPIQEIDKEELGTATLVFTPVEKSETNGQTTYKTTAGEEIQEIKFEGKNLLPPVGAHLHLHVGETYKMELKTTDFAGRASQQTFVERASTHQAFLFGAETGSLDLVYGDENVGVTTYITILKESNTSQLRYIMRHLNAGVKDRIQSTDWNNSNFTQFTGANDLDLKFEVHFVEHDHEGH